MGKADKIINYRPMLIVAIGFMLAIALSLLVWYSLWAFWCIFCGFALLSIVLIVIKKYKVAVFFVAFIVGFGASYLQFISITNFNDKEEYFIDAQVVDVYQYSGSNFVILDKLTVDGFKVKGNASMRVENSDEDISYAINDKVKLYGQIRNNTKNLTSMYALNEYANRNYYDITVLAELSKEKGKGDFFYLIKERIISPMKGNLTKDNQGIACSLLFGDKRYLSYADNTAIKSTGLSHIFAVSGLHICFVVAIIAFLFKKLRLNKLLALVIMAIVLFIYCGVTAFPPSALRASIMAIIFILSAIVHKKSDSLSNLSTAIVVILLISPSTLFSISFLMSVSAVFGIILFFKPINNFLLNESKHKFRRAVSNSIALSVSANVFLLPLTVNSFGMLSVYFVIANLLVLPIVTICYIYLFLSAMACIISPYFGFLYILSNLLINVIRLFTFAISSLPFATLRVSNIGLFSIIYVLIMVIISRFVLVSRYQKLVSVTTILIVGVMLGLMFG